MSSAMQIRITVDARSCSFFPFSHLLKNDFVIFLSWDRVIFSASSSRVSSCAFRQVRILSPIVSIMTWISVSKKCGFFIFLPPQIFIWRAYDISRCSRAISWNRSVLDRKRALGVATVFRGALNPVNTGCEKGGTDKVNDIAWNGGVLGVEDVFLLLIANYWCLLWLVPDMLQNVKDKRKAEMKEIRINEEKKNF